MAHKSVFQYNPLRTAAYGLERWFCPLAFMSWPGSNHAAEPPLQKRSSNQRGLYLHIYLAPGSTASLTVGKKPSGHIPVVANLDF